MTYPQNILISIIIPVKNGESTLTKCLDAIFSQTIISQTEVIVIDSGSTDNSTDIIKKYPVRLYQIQPEAFNHGATRNYGVSLANGELVYMTVQDATIADNEMLERMSKHFDDEQVMAVSGRQSVPQNKNINPHHWYRPISTPNIERYCFETQSEFESLPDSKKRWVCGTDDVNTMYRKSALLQLPFRPLLFAEDIAWAYDAYLRGFTIILDTSARVWHYHSPNYSYNYRLALFCIYAEWKFLHIAPLSKFRTKDAILLLYRNIKYRAHPKWVFKELINRWATHRAIKDFSSKIKISNVAAEQFFEKYTNVIPQGKSAK